MTALSQIGALTDDGFVGGELKLLQPRAGHRFGTDAALLAAAARSRLVPGEAVADLGSGVGSVGLALAHWGARRAALVEIDPTLADLARENAARNGLSEIALAVCADVAEVGRARGPEAAGPEAFSLVVTNPPFDDAGRFQVSPDAGKARAHADGGDVIETWALAATRLLRPGGTLVMIHRAEALAGVLAALSGRFGDVRLRPVHPRAGAPATRLLIAARKGRRAAPAILPGLVLHGESGAFTPEIDAIQKGRATIAL